MEKECIFIRHSGNYPNNFVIIVVIRATKGYIRTNDGGSIPHRGSGHRPPGNSTAWAEAGAQGAWMVEN